MTPGRPVLTIVACGAGPAAAISTCITLARDRGWTVQVTATPAAARLISAVACRARRRVYDDAEAPTP